MRKLMMTLVMAAAVSVAALQAKAQEQVAPGFTLPNSTGADINLSDYAGKVVVLEWYNKDCPFVRKHYDSKNMQNLQSAFVAKDVAWLTIVSSAEGKQGYLSQAEAEAQIVKEGMNATELLRDVTGDVARMYGAQVTPHMFVIDTEGNIVYRGAIDSINSPNPDDIKDAVPYLANAVDAVLAGKPVEKLATAAYGCSIKF